MRKTRSTMVAGVLAVAALTGTGGAVQATPQNQATPNAAASSCDGGPWYPDPSANLPKPYSFSYGTSYVRHAQKKISDKAWAEIETNNADVTIWLENKDGKVCGPTSVKRSDGSRGKKYYASVAYLNNAGHSVRACMSHPKAGEECGKWKTEDSDGNSAGSPSTTD